MEYIIKISEVAMFILIMQDLFGAVVFSSDLRSSNLY